MKRHRHELHLLLAVLVVVVLTTLLDAGHNYWHDPADSARIILRHTAVLGIFSLGAAVVIIAGGIDLSSGSVIAFCGTLCATVMLLLEPEAMIAGDPLATSTVLLAIAVTLAGGFLIGTLHAWLITIVRLPPFVATLATLVGLRSLGRAICENATELVLGGRSTQIQIYDENFRALGRTVWIPLLLFLTITALVWLMMSRTVVGRHLYALGGSEQAAKLSGIRTDRLKWLAYSLSAVLSAIAGILLIGNQSVASPQTLGRGYELNAIAAAVVGGCSLQGGAGTIPGTALGALFLRAVIDGVAKIIKTGADVYEGLIVGVVVVFAVAFTRRQESSSQRSFFPGRLGLVSMFNMALLAAALAALIGPRLLQSLAAGTRFENQLHLSGFWLALLAGLPLLVTLLARRFLTCPARRRLVAPVVLVLALLAAVFVNSQLPGWRYQRALRAVQAARGTVVSVADGTAVVLSSGTTPADAGTPPSQPQPAAPPEAVLAGLTPLTDLTELRLTGPTFTDYALEHVARLPVLRRLVLQDTAITAGGLRRLARQRPQLEVSRSP